MRRYLLILSLSFLGFSGAAVSQVMPDAPRVIGSCTTQQTCLAKYQESNARFRMFYDSVGSNLGQGYGQEYEKAFVVNLRDTWVDNALYADAYYQTTMPIFMQQPVPWNDADAMLAFFNDQTSTVNGMVSEMVSPYDHEYALYPYVEAQPYSLPPAYSVGGGTAPGGGTSPGGGGTAPGGGGTAPGGGETGGGGSGGGETGGETGGDNGNPPGSTPGDIDPATLSSLSQVVSSNEMKSSVLTVAYALFGVLVLLFGIRVITRKIKGKKGGKGGTAGGKTAAQLSVARRARAASRSK